MGILCKIVRNEDNSIQYVEAPNGNQSKLFQDLKEMDLTDQEALDAWTVSNTEAFKKDILLPKINAHKKIVFNKLKSLRPKNNMVKIIFGNKDVEVDITKLKYTTKKTSQGITIFTTTEVNGRDEQVGRIRLKEFRDGFRIDSSLLNDLRTYENGKVGSIKGKGIGTEMYKRVAQSLIRNGSTLYSNVTSSPEAEGVWNKLNNLGIVETELTNKGRYFIISAKPSSFDENNEPSAKDVLSYIGNSNNESVDTLSEEEVVSLSEAMLNTGLNSSDELIEEWNNIFFKNGGFEVTRAGLSNSNLYTKAEQQAILETPELQEQIRNAYYKIKASPSVLNDMYVNRDFITIKDTRPNMIGKFNINNPFINEKNAIKELAGTTSREEFEALLLESDLDYLKQKYYEKRGSSEDIFYNMSDFVNIPVKEIREGELVDKLENSVSELLGETLTDPSDTKIIEEVVYLTSISPEVWNTNPKEMKTLLREFSKKTIDIGLDTIGIEDYYDVKTIAEFQELFNTIDSFIGNQNDETFNNLTQVYKNFFGINEELALETVQNVQGKPVYLKTEKSAFELFSKYGLLPVGKDVYRRVNNTRTVEDVYESMYLNIVDNPSILPMGAYEFARDKDGDLNRSVLNDLNNKSRAIDSMRNFVRSEINKIDSHGVPRDTDMLEKMYLYASFFNTPLNSIKDNPTALREITLIENYPSNTEYLTGEYVSDFNKKYLTEKLKNSKAFQDFYSNFAITNRGIRLINTDPLTMEKMKIGIKQEPNLEIHLLLQKDSQFKPIIEENDRLSEDDLVLRNYYANFPTALNKFVGEYSTIDNNTILAKTGDNFLRNDQGVFEMVDSYGDYSVFKRIEPNLTSYKAYSKEFTKPVNKLDLSSYGITSTNEGAEVTINNKYSKAEETNIDNKIDNCG